MKYASTIKHQIGRWYSWYMLVHQLGALQTKLGGASLVATNTVIKSSRFGTSDVLALGECPFIFG
jgi:hypothetical protein